MSSKKIPIAQVISLRLLPELLERLDEIASYQERSRTDIIKTALVGYLDNCIWLEAQVNQGLDDLKNDDVALDKCSR